MTEEHQSPLWEEKRKTESVPKTYISSWVEMIHEWAHKQEFYDNVVCYRSDGESGQDCSPQSGNTFSALMLIITRLGKAGEALHRKDRDNFREEIADVVIRLFDLCGACGINLEEEISKKMSKNFSHPYRHGKTG